MASVVGGFDKLPREALLEILKRVHEDAGNDVLICMEVCKEWQAAVRATTSKLQLLKSPRPQQALLGIANYESLQTLRIQNCGFLNRVLGGWTSAFEALGANCPSLAAIHIIAVKPMLLAEDVAALIRSCNTIHSLELVACTFFAHMPSLDHLTALQSLTLADFGRFAVVHRNLQLITTLPSLHMLTQLTSLVLQLHHLTSLPRIDTLRNLLVLNVSHSRLTHLPPLCGSPLLQALDLSGNDLRDLDLTHSPLLSSLTLANPGITRVIGLEIHKSLHHLQVIKDTSPPTRNLTDLESVLLPCLVQPRWERVPHLRRLTLEVYGPEMCSIHLLPELEELTLSHISRTLNSNTLPNLAMLSRLRVLHLQCRKINRANVVEDLATLEELTIACCNELDKLPCLAALTRLRSLVVTDCLWVVEIPRLDTLVNLTRLVFKQSGCLREIPPLDGTPHLRHLDLELKGGVEILSFVESLPVLTHLSELTHLRLRGCSSLRSVPLLPAGLRTLDVGGLDSFDPPPLEALVLLQNLTLDDCRGFQELPSLSGLNFFAACGAELPGPHGSLSSLQPSFFAAFEPSRMLQAYVCAPTASPQAATPRYSQEGAEAHRFAVPGRRSGWTYSDCSDLVVGGRYEMRWETTSQASED